MTTPRSSSVLVLVLAVHSGLVLPSRRSGVAVAGGLEGGRVVHGFGVCMGRFSSVGPPKLALSRIRNRGWESGTKTRQDKTRQGKARQDRERAPCLFRNRYSIQLPSARQVQYGVLRTGYWILVLYDLGMPSCSSCRASGLRNLYLDSLQLQYSTVQYSTVQYSSTPQRHNGCSAQGSSESPGYSRGSFVCTVLYVWSWGSFKVPAKGGRSEILEFHVRQKEVRE
jgi:hypothetical protein